MKTIVAVFILIAIQMNLITIQSVPIHEVVFKIKRYNMPEACALEGTSYCFEKGDHYPENDIAALLYDLTDLSIDSYDYNDIDLRNGDENPDCPSRWTDKPIYYIIDKSNTVRVVVQMPEKFQQIYTVKWCLNEGQIKNETTNFLLNTTLAFHNMECVNMRMNYDFFVLSENGASLERVKAKGGIPVCCRCRQMD